MPATDQQMQKFSDERLRGRCQQIRALLLAVEDDIACIGDVYETARKGEWKDARTDGPPCLMTCDMILGINAVLHDVQKLLRSHAELPIVLKACVQSVGG